MRTPTVKELEALRVVVVDDHADVLEMVSTVLGNQGARVTACANPFGAEDVLRGFAADVLLTDILMPGCDGFQLLRSARAAGFAGAAVAITAADMDIVERLPREGFHSHLRKPLEPDSLVATVKAASRVREPRAAGEMLRGVRVLLIEDHADTLLTYAEGLGRHGAEVSTASTAQMGLVLLERQRPDVLVVDIGLPDVSGNDFLRRVRAMRPRRGWDIPAIALTAYNSLQDRLRTVDAGFRMHVPKPVDPSYLAALVADLAAHG